MSNQLYCLRWNNHQPNFISTFSSLFADECLVDVTLAAEGKYLQAHRVVLSACSSYFQKLFSVNPTQHPIVVLKDVAYEDLRSVVDFMYHGEVNVTPEQLHSVLKTAETLKIKGLADMPVTSIYETGSTEKTDELPASLRRKRFKKSGRSDATSSPIEEIEILGPSHLSIKSEDYSDFVKHLSTSSEERSFRNGCQNNTSCSYEASCPAESKFIEITSAPPLVRPEENTAGISVITGVKRRNRLLTRQPHIGKSDLDAEESSDSDLPRSVKRPLGRQYSDPTPQQNLPLATTSVSEEKPHLLAVPPSSHLQKQNSDSSLPFHRESADQTNLPTELTKDTAMMSQGPQPRSNHCPMLRPGPALGCNFCWNTIDNHGRILRRKTKYHCPECRTNLCIVPCFQDYHKRKEFSENESDHAKTPIKEEPTDAAFQTCPIQKHPSSGSSMT